MTTNELAGTKVDKLLIPALSIIFSVLSLAYTFLSSLVIFLFMVGALFLDALFENSWFYFFCFVAITFLAFKIVMVLPLQLKRAVFFTCLLLIAIIIMLTIGIGFRIPVFNGDTVSNPYVLNFLLSGMSFGFVIGINIKVIVYGFIHSLVVGHNIPHISRQNLVTGVLVGILIGVITGLQISFIRLMRLEGFIPNYGFITGCIAVIALFLSTKETTEEKGSNISPVSTVE